MARFIGYHLGPTFEAKKVDAQIFLGDMNESKRGGYSYWVAPSMLDPNVRRYLNGVGCQWDADLTMAETHCLFPDLKLMQTETECGKTNSNDWVFAERQFQLAKKWFGAGASSNIIWNLVLDETGLSTANWAQCSPIVVNSKTKEVTYTPFYYLYKHFSYFIEPGARVASTFSAWGDHMAFVNPDGSVVVVVGNSAKDDLPITINVNGKQSATIMLPAHSFHTFTVSAPGV